MEDEGEEEEKRRRRRRRRGMIILIQESERMESRHLMYFNKNEAD